MITINLVPQEHKEKIQRKKIYVSIKEALLIILLFSSVASILLILSKFYLEDQLARLTDQNSHGIAAIQLTNTKIKALNNKIIEAYTVQKNFKSWTAAINPIHVSKGDKITFSSLKIFKQQSSIEITGVAKTRADLVAFQKRLQKIDGFTKVNLPISDLINKGNNGFTIRIEIDLNKLP
ncbi:MAG: PilN domain-containing protein [Candidatus Buchananbacteria bacterium]